LGHGGSARVGRVRHKLTGKYFACKRIARGRTFEEQRHQLVEFEQELNVLQRVRHKHLVSCVGSYTDLDSFSLILHPVADQVLKDVLMCQDREHPLPTEEISCLGAAFGCLADAISYLHDHQVRHKDIKPGNVLISGGGRIYLCDFGISRDWSTDGRSTTEGNVFRYTQKYCAPEVIGQGSRNESSDIWSLGTVFLELI
ncbi:kinase-like protein, partial [Lophium mytilinum]